MNSQVSINEINLHCINSNGISYLLPRRNEGKPRTGQILVQLLPLMSFFIFLSPTKMIRTKNKVKATCGTTN